MSRIVSSTRGALYTAMISPALTYQIDENTPVTLASTSVYPRAVWELSAGGSNIVFPAVFIDVSDGGSVNRYLYNVYKFGAKIWCVSSTGPDEATAIGDAIVKRIEFADTQGGWDAADMSNAGGSTSLPVIFHQLRLQRYSGAQYEQTTSKWYVTMDFDGIAQ